jgi:hypothetical protein
LFFPPIIVGKLARVVESLPTIVGSLAQFGQVSQQLSAALPKLGKFPNNCRQPCPIWASSPTIVGSLAQIGQVPQQLLAALFGLGKFPQRLSADLFGLSKFPNDCRLTCSELSKFPNDCRLTCSGLGSSILYSIPDINLFMKYKPISLSPVGNSDEGF